METSTYQTPIEELGSEYAKSDLARMGVTHVRFLAEGGTGENRIAVYAYAPPEMYEMRFATTNALPVWEEDDPAIFAALLTECEITL